MTKADKTLCNILCKYSLNDYPFRVLGEILDNEDVDKIASNVKNVLLTGTDMAFINLMLNYFRLTNDGYDELFEYLVQYISCDVRLESAKDDELVPVFETTMSEFSAKIYVALLDEYGDAFDSDGDGYTAAACMKHVVNAANAIENSFK